MRKHYFDFMQKLLESHAEPVPDKGTPQSNHRWYLPHFGVYLLKLINNSKSQLQITACIPLHMHVFGYPVKNRMKIFRDLDIVTKSLEIWTKYPNVH